MSVLTATQMIQRISDSFNEQDYTGALGMATDGVSHYPDEQPMMAYLRICALVRLDRLIAQSPLAWLDRKAALLESQGKTAEARDAYRQILGHLQKLPPHRRQSARFAALRREAEAKLKQGAEGGP